MPRWRRLFPYTYAGMLECTLRGKYWQDGVYSQSERRLVLRSDFVTQGEHSMAGAIHLESMPPAGMGTSRKKPAIMPALEGQSNAR